MNGDEILAAFHRVLTLKDREVCAAIDAANCQTAYDWRKSHEAKDALAEAVEQFEQTIAALAHDPPMITLQDVLARYSSADAASVKQAIDAIRESEPARAIARLAKVAEAREQFSIASERQRRTREAQAVERHVTTSTR
ncbi:hypothetical protein ACNOYE_24135 [Nannocystaceae bacterium ST9]